MATNVQVQLASRPTGWVQESNFRVAETPLPKPGPGQFLVKSLWLSLDPYMRGRMSDAKSYATPVQIGDVMVGGAVGEVVESNNPKFTPGDHVVGRRTSEAAQRRDVVDRLEQVRLALPVVAMDHVEPRPGLEPERLEVSKPAQRQPRQPKRIHHEAATLIPRGTLHCQAGCKRAPQS